MRVAIVGAEICPVPPIRGGAVELGIHEVAPILAEHIEEVHVLCPADPDLPNEETVRGVHYHRLRFGNRIGLRKDRPLAYARSVVRCLRALRPDIVHIRQRPLTVNLVRRALGRETKIILHMHNLLEHLGKRERPRAGYVPDCDAFAACSRYVLENELPRYGLQPEIGHVILNGVNPSAFQPICRYSEQRIADRIAHGISEDAPVVLFAGKIRPDKGIQHLADAMEIVFRAVPNAVLVVAGGATSGLGKTEQDNEFTLRMKARFRALDGKVIVTGFVQPAGIPRVYAMADVFCAPSVWQEPFGLVLVEAQASGLPVVSTNRGGVPETMVPGQTGILVDDPADTEVLAAPIIKLLTDPDERRRMGENARRHVESNLTWHKTAEVTLNLYRSLMAGGA